MMLTREEALRIAWLEAKVAALEEALARRSHELLLLQRHLTWRDLLLLARLDAGLPPLPLGAFQMDAWSETSDLLPAEVEETLRELWRSLRPAEAGEGPEGAGSPPGVGGPTRHGGDG